MCNSVDCDCAYRPTAAMPSTAAAIEYRATSTEYRLISLRLSGRCARSLRSVLPGIELGLVLLVGEVVPGDPREAHLVDGPLAAADPVARIGIGFGGRVVVPADDVQHRPRRIDRRHIVRIDADDVPVEAPVGAVDLFDLVVRINQFDALALAACVHVRLARGDLPRLVEAGVTVAPDPGRSARNVEGLGGRG